MKFNIAVAIEQAQRVENDKVAVEERINEQANRQKDLYSEGEFDGLIGIEPNPEMWGELSYRSGFLTGITRYYDKNYQMSLNNPHSRASEPF